MKYRKIWNLSDKSNNLTANFMTKERVELNS